MIPYTASMPPWFQTASAVFTGCAIPLGAACMYLGRKFQILADLEKAVFGKPSLSDRVLALEVRSEVER